ncbi:Glutamate receptor 3 [Papilio machaon]|uniref:Glutamate receptor 3 n=1 Tax=Papilio machaon TaxID=76193 RepID=A0A194QT07_PAPMA|nr:Glutamate receptor 3 [Papilio machaon]
MIQSTSIRRHDLSRHEIKIAYVITNNDSLYHLSDGVNDHIDTITKVNVLATNYLLDFLNASKKFIFVDTWGYPDNNTWNGMTGCLVRGEVEIGGSPMFFTLARLPIVEFISSPVPSRSKFVFRQPKLSYENNLFILSFRHSVWYSIGAVLIFLFLALFGVTFWEWKRNDHDIDLRLSEAGILRANTSDIAILIFGATCQQGSPVELKGTLGRVVLLVLFLTVLFLHTSFSANIVALLQSSSSRIRTLEDLLQSRLKFGVHDNPFNRHYFATMSEPIRKAIYDTKIAPPGVPPRFLSMEDGVQKIRQGLFAFHMETGVGYKFVGKYFEEGEKCGLNEIQYLQVADPWIAVRKNTPYLEMYKIGTKRIIEHGLQYRENRRLYERRPTCSGSDGNFVSVSMVDCYPAILVLSYGILIATLILIVEILYRYKLSILKAYKIGPKNKEWIIEYFGSWDQTRGLVKSKEMQMSMAIRRKDLLGEPITISTVITDNRTKSELFNMRQVSETNIHRDTLTKSSFLQYMPVYDFINATKVIMYADTWGYLANGTFNGMVGHMARGEAELGGTLMFITRERLSVLNYMNYPGSLSVKFVFREPALSYQHNLFLLPFKPIVWCCIIALVFILIFILFINARWESIKAQNEDMLDNSVLKPNISDIAILVMSAISQQGSSTELKGALGRSVIFILFMAFVFLYTSYSASIVALLQSSSSAIRTLSDLLDSRLELGAEDTPYNRHYFPAATEPVKKAIYQNKIAPRGSKPNFMKLEDGVRKLQKEPFAFNMNTGTGYRLVDQYFYEHEKCGLQEISYFSNNKPWQTCRKDSPYKQILKIGSLRSQEHGLNLRVNKQLYSTKPTCNVKGGNFGSVNMVDFYPAVLTLVYGISITMLRMQFFFGGFGSVLSDDNKLHALC